MKSNRTAMALLSPSILSANRTAAEIFAAATQLAALMRSVHGGTWSIDICHDACFVAVSRDFP